MKKTLFIILIFTASIFAQVKPAFTFNTHSKYSINLLYSNIPMEYSSLYTTNNFVIENLKWKPMPGREPIVLVKQKLLANIQPVEKINMNPDQENESNEEEGKSFWSENLYYFLGAAALAAVVYIIWIDEDDTPQAKTFGYPLKP